MGETEQSTSSGTSNARTPPIYSQTAAKERISIHRLMQLGNLAAQVCEELENKGLKRNEVCLFGVMCNRILNR